MELGLQGRTALVTGASKGIGLGVAQALAAEGCHVHLVARSGALLDEEAHRIASRYQVRATGHAMDLSDTCADSSSSLTFSSMNSPSTEKAVKRPPGPPRPVRPSSRPVDGPLCACA